ncbi:MAG: DNA polymerase III subunit epsilon [Pseudonocardia sp.]|nr:DNA polymerase III subunit epsilon [Pseudonocardia sp.]
MTSLDEPVTEHDLRCPEIEAPQLLPDPDRCTCRDADGKTRRESWVTGPISGFDLETTHADPELARIVTATVVEIRPGQDKVVHEWLSDVDGEEIPQEAAEIHGVTTERARAEGRPHAEVVAEIRQVLGQQWRDAAAVAGWNLSYDFTVLAHECLRIRQATPFLVTGYVLDGFVLDKAADRYRRGKRTLTAAAEHYRIHLSEEDAHSSAADALAAARVIWRIAAQDHPWIGELPLPELHKRQVRWFTQQQQSFAKYLRDKVAPGIDDPEERAALLDRADDVDAQADGWPLRGAS